MDEHEMGHLTDLGDLAERAQEMAIADAIADLAERARPRFTPLLVEGEYCCPECVEPLPPHRMEAGICVDCLTQIEQHDRLYRRPR